MEFVNTCSLSLDFEEIQQTVDQKTESSFRDAPYFLKFLTLLCF